jgi:hypothetical protein
MIYALLLREIGRRTPLRMRRGRRPCHALFRGFRPFAAPSLHFREDSLDPLDHELDARETLQVGSNQ